MALKSLRDILNHARERRYGVGAFAASTLEEIEGIMLAAEEERSPVILILGSWILDKADVELLSIIALRAGERASVPVALHLDHGRTREQIVSSIRFGFTSGMFDGSQLPFDENIAQTREMTGLFHAAGMDAEAELGQVGSGSKPPTDEEKQQIYTRPEDVVPFVEQTEIDAIAIAFGTGHGRYKQAPQLDFERLDAIEAVSPVPLVLHGASDTPEDQICEAIRRGITKLNIATDLVAAYQTTLKEATSGESAPHPLALSPVLRDAVKELVRYKMRLFGSSGKT